MSRFCTLLTLAVCLAYANVAILSCHSEKQLPGSKFISTYATSDHRPSLLRIAAFPYAPSPSVQRGTPSSNDALRLAAYGVLAASDGYTTVEDIRVQAAARLVLGQPAEVASLMKVHLQRRPAEPLLWNDYAVALYETGIRTHDPQKLTASLVATDKAISLSPTMPEAICNRAAILETLHLRRAAVEMWTRCVDIEPSSAWRAEARSRLDVLSRPSATERWANGKYLRIALLSGRVDEAERIVRDFRQESRTWCEGEVLSQWADLRIARKQAQADEALKVAHFVGAWHRQFGGEWMLNDSVAAIERSRAIGGVEDDLARAHITYRSARIAIAQRRPSEAIAPLIESEIAFIRAGSPMFLVARYYRAGAMFDSQGAAPARALLEMVEDELGPSYVALRGLVLWERSRIAGRIGDVYQSLDLSKQAVQIFDRLGEELHAARMRMAMATSLAVLGRSHDAWQLRQEIFRVVTDRGTANELERALHTLSLSELSEGHLETAASLLDVQLSSESVLPLLHFEARLWRTFIAIRLGESQTADAHLVALRNLASLIPEKKQRDNALDDLRFAEASLQINRDPARAVRLFSETIASRQNAERMHDLPDAYVQRARGQRRLNDENAAIRDLETALRMLELQRLTIAAPDLRDSFFSSSNAACRDLLELHARRSDSASAFDVAERCRARGLIDALSYSHVAPSPMSAGEIQRRLPRNTVLIHYSVLERHTIAFLLTRDSLQLFVLPTGLDLIKRYAAKKTASLPELHSALIAPLAHELNHTQTLIVVPDETTAGVPFNALHAASAADPLIRQMRVVVAPSASYYAAAVDVARPRLGGDVLVVGDPAFDSKLFSNERLPGAAQEARAIAAMYPSSALLIGTDATVEGVLSSLAHCDIAHIATHALISDQDSTLSVLLMAATASEPGSLYPGQISSLRLHRAPLVILAGCRTAAAGPGRGSIRGFVSSFLSAGSRGVIATLWDVNDDDTERFSRALHARIRTGQSTGDALRETQLEMSRSSDPVLRRPEVWGAFQLYGVP